jgi:hypothetical protein
MRAKNPKVKAIAEIITTIPIKPKTLRMSIEF